MVFFKKKKLAGKQHFHSFMISPILAGIGVFFLGFFTIQAFEGDLVEVLPKFISSGGTLLYKEENPLQHNLSDSGKNITYILLTGRGGGNHEAPNLTDTIILAGINKKAQNISLLSIPRDLWVKYPNGSQGKINGIFESENENGDEYAIKKLEEKIQQITGKKIDFYMNIDFEGFKQVVNALGGVEVTLDENLVDYEYPDGAGGYKTFILRKGTWTLDGDVALMYARSRHSTSDFDRSLRQQQIIDAIKAKAGELGYLSDSKTILELYNIFKTYVQTDMSLKDIVKVGLTIKGWEDKKTLSFNLNNSCYYNSPICDTGGFLYTPLRDYFGGASVLLPNEASVSKYETYDEIQKFSTIIFETPQIFSLLDSLYIVNTSGIGGLAGDISDSMKPYGIKIPSSQLLTNTEKKFENGILQYNNLENKKEILTALSYFFSGSTLESDAPSYATGAKIEIIVSNSTNIISN